MQQCPRSIKKTLHRIFSCPVLSGAFRATLLKAFPLHKAFPLQFCLRGIKTTLYRNFSCAMYKVAEGFSETTLPQEYQDNIVQDYFLCNVVWSLLDNIAQDFNRWNVVLGVLRQHCRRFFLVKCCLQSLGEL